MRGIRIFTASLAFAVVAPLALSATADYFPLAQGNSWAFKAASRTPISPQSIEVDGKETFRDREYLKVRFFGRTVFLRQAGGVIYSFNRDAGQERTWLDFSAADGPSFPVDLDSCTASARITSRAEKVRTPAGEWDNALQLTFEQSCNDAGVTTMSFVPGLGPVVYETTSIAGPVRWELLYNRVGSTTAEAPQIAFTVGLDSPVYKTAEVVDITTRLTLRNSHEQPIILDFPSGQRYDLRIWNDRGEGVYTWSADKLFPQIISSEPLTGERTFVFTSSVPNLPPGRYVVEAWLATRAREYVGIVGFEVTR